MPAIGTEHLSLAWLFAGDHVAHCIYFFSSATSPVEVAPWVTKDTSVGCAATAFMYSVRSMVRARVLSGVTWLGTYQRSSVRHRR